LLLTDLGMPYMAGDDLARNVLRLRPETRVLIVSARGDGQRAVQGPVVPGAEFMAKPFTLGSLTRTVRRILDSSPEEGVQVQAQA
ncbi:MAG TPA: response regulator, partial [Vicinamibacteria bacterium]|nr:response regulator [Vicinamibacteria bacterium]